MTDRERHLSRLVASVPIHVIDLGAAHAAGDLEALRYATAIRAWLDEAAAVMAAQIRELVQAQPGGRVESRACRGRGPVGEASSELVSVRDFPPGLAV